MILINCYGPARGFFDLDFRRANKLEPPIPHPRPFRSTKPPNRIQKHKLIWPQYRTWRRNCWVSFSRIFIWRREPLVLGGTTRIPIQNQNRRRLTTNGNTISTAVCSGRIDATFATFRPTSNGQRNLCTAQPNFPTTSQTPASCGETYL